MARDKNDGRVTFMRLAGEYGLTVEQAKALWRSIHPPFPASPNSGDGDT